jgi:hypothetical protein
VCLSMLIVRQKAVANLPMMRVVSHCEMRKP